MKSAYELAMERLGKSEPTLTLTKVQKAEIADIESLYKSRLAQKEIAMNGEIDAAEAAGQFEKAFEGRKQLVIERAKLEEEKEAKKDLVRNRK
ncbi:MAG TPA: hypothetical protein VMF06_21745 [Candidatus Limnocylindria bacterium]|nr:hypothetical protein [Candidatus Limnocylindria bacterium]